MPDFLIPISKLIPDIWAYILDLITDIWPYILEHFIPLKTHFLIVGPILVIIATGIVSKIETTVGTIYFWKPGRKLSGIFVLLGLAIFFISFKIPEKIPSLEINGKMFHSKLLPDEQFDHYDIHLIPKHMGIESDVDKQGNFNFLKSANLEEGTYKLEILKRTGINGEGEFVHKEEIELKPRVNIIITKNNNQYDVKISDYLIFFKTKYYSKNWEDRVQAIEQLSRITRSPNNPIRKTKVFYSSVLGENCDEFARSHLESILKKDSDPFNLNRVASYLMCFNDTKTSGKKYLYKILQENNAQNTGNGDPNIPVSAAIRLAKHDSYQVCIIEHLIAGLNLKSELTKKRSRNALITITQNRIGNVSSGWGYLEWNEWFENNKNSIPSDDCNNYS